MELFETLSLKNQNAINKDAAYKNISNNMGPSRGASRFKPRGIFLRCVPTRHHMAGETKGTGKMTVEEAGHLGGHKGGQKVKRLIEEGKEMEKAKKAKRS
jgi:hypothetical protein